MEEYYGHNDWRDYLAHSWGDSPKQKAREKEYNHEYWLKNKERLLKKRHAGRYLTNTGQSKEGWEFLDGSTYSYRKPSGDPSGGGDQYLTAHGRSSNFARRYGEANRQAQIHSEVSALKAQNAANYQQNQARKEIAGLKAQNAANYQAQQNAQNQAEIAALKNTNARRYAASQAVAKKGYQSSGGNNVNDSGTGTSYATSRQNQINSEVARHKTANVAAAKKGRDALNYLLQ